MGYIILNPSNDLPEMSSGNTLITVNDNGYLILKTETKETYIDVITKWKDFDFLATDWETITEGMALYINKVTDYLYSKVLNVKVYQKITSNLYEEVEVKIEITHDDTYNEDTKISLYINDTIGFDCKVKVLFGD